MCILWLNFFFFSSIALPPPLGTHLLSNQQSPQILLIHWFKHSSLPWPADPNLTCSYVPSAMNSNMVALSSAIGQDKGQVSVQGNMCVCLRRTSDSNDSKVMTGNNTQIILTYKSQETISTIIAAPHMLWRMK